jgi:hypothetical protein
MDNDLQKEIQSVVVDGGRGSYVSEEKAVQLIRDLAAQFSFDVTKLFIWANKNLHSIYEYGDDPEKWKETLRDLLDRFDEDIFIVVSNEVFYPWRILNCRKQGLPELLQELPSFEYFIFDSSLQYVVFDTHDNFFVDFIQSWIRI